MDALDLVAEPATVLLDRVDDVLRRTGAPDRHPVWVPLRRLGILPGAALRAVLALRPGPLGAPATALRDTARGYADAAAALPAAGGWHGPAADAYGGQVTALADELAAGRDSLAERLVATARYADALADWVSTTRATLAEALARALVSAEAVTVLGTAGPDPGAGGRLAQRHDAAVGVRLDTEVALAAADLAVGVLEPVVAGYDRAEDLLDDHAGLAAVRPYRGAGPLPGGFGGTLRLDGQRGKR